MLEVELHVSRYPAWKATSEKLVEQAHLVCPYLNATRGNIPVILTVEGQPGFSLLLLRRDGAN